MTTDREKLIEELRAWYLETAPTPVPYYEFFDDLADFILEDRKRVADQAVYSYRHGESMQKLQEGTHEDR